MTPNPGFVYRTIGGILDIYIFMGPTPSDANIQYSEAVGEEDFEKMVFLICDVMVEDVICCGIKVWCMHCPVCVM